MIILQNSHMLSFRLQEHVKIDGGRATVTYTPMTELDYGTLLCWGSNSVGQQQKPCVFHVFPAGKSFVYI